MTDKNNSFALEGPRSQIEKEQPHAYIKASCFRDRDTEFDIF